MTRFSWTPKLIEDKIREAVSLLDLDRMPTRSELQTLSWGNALGCKVSRTGGFDGWADRLSLPRAQHCSRRGWRWEEWFVDQCIGRDLSATRQEFVRSPFDVKVSAHKIEVKSAEYKDHGSSVRGWVFRIHNLQVSDFIVAICLRDEVPDKVYIIPANKVARSMLTIVSSGRGKYEPYLNRWDLLE